jgi:predicted phosphohydrolase
MKDYWRPKSKKLYTELAAYERLQEKGVRHVATAIAGGDVENQKTVTQEYLEEEKKPLEHVHCRLVLQELARPLSDYKYSSEMIILIYHALEGECHDLVSRYLE